MAVFSAPPGNISWIVDSLKNALASVNTARPVLVLQGPEHEYNHIETPLPEGAHAVQVDICPVNDISAS